MATFKRQQNTININAETKIVLEAFLNALKSHKLEQSALAPTTLQKKKGFWKVVTTFEDLFDKSLNGRTHLLPALDLEMDDHANDFIKEYIDFWNIILEEDKIDLKQLLANGIESPLILIKELLIRICADAISQNMSGDHDGEILVQVMETFIDNVRPHSDILKLGFLSKKYSQTSLVLITEHNDWLVSIKNLVGGVKLLHANKTALSNASDLINKTELAILRLILAELSSEAPIAQLKYRFADDFVKRGVKQLENELIIRDQKIAKDSEEKNLSVVKYVEQLNLTDLDKQTIILRLINDTKESNLRNNLTKKVNLDYLYQLWNDTKTICDMMNSAHIFNVLTGWIGIVTGSIRMDGFAKLFHIYADEVKEKLIFNCEKLESKGSRIEGLMENRVDGINLSNECHKFAGQLAALQLPEIKSKIIKLIASSVASLSTLQTNLTGKYQGIEVVNLNLCEHFIEELQKTALPQPAHPPGSLRVIDISNGLNDSQGLRSSPLSLSVDSSLPKSTDTMNQNTVSTEHYGGSSESNSSVLKEAPSSLMLQKNLPVNTLLFPINKNEVAGFYLSFLNAYQHTPYATRKILDINSVKDLIVQYTSNKHHAKKIKNWCDSYAKAGMSVSTNDIHHPLIAGRILCKKINHNSLQIHIVYFENPLQAKLATISCVNQKSDVVIQDYTVDKLSLNEKQICIIHSQQDYYYAVNSNNTLYPEIITGTKGNYHLKTDGDLSDSGKYSCQTSEADSSCSLMESSMEAAPIPKAAKPKQTNHRISLFGSGKKSKKSQLDVSQSVHPKQQEIKPHRAQELIEIHPLVSIVATIMDKNDIGLLQALFNDTQSTPKQHFKDEIAKLPNSEFKDTLQKLSGSLTDNDYDIIKMSNKNKESIFELILTAHNPWAVKILLNIPSFTSIAVKYLDQSLLSQIYPLSVPSSFIELPVLKAVRNIVDYYKNNIMSQRNWSADSVIKKDREEFLNLFELAYENACRTGIVKPLSLLIRLHSVYDNDNKETRGYCGRSQLYDPLRAVISEYLKTKEGRADEGIGQLDNQLKEYTGSLMRQGKFKLQYNPDQQKTIDGLHQTITEEIENRKLTEEINRKATEKRDQDFQKLCGIVADLKQELEQLKNVNEEQKQRNMP
ncbi:MAG: hypothetical protein Q8M40_11565 [Legionella sp.]|nr:hypothetical protein [Legionella sp.]